MKDAKKETLAELYALRAGLSVLSVECSRLRAEDERARRMGIRIEDNSANLANYDSITSSSKKTYKSAKHDYNKAKREYDKKSFPLLVWTLALLCLAAAAIYVYYLRLSAKENILLYNIALVAFGIGAAFSAFKALLINRKVKPLKKTMRHARELMRDSKTWIDESAKGAELVREETRILKDSYLDQEAFRDSVSAISVPLASSVFTALKNTFAGVLGESYFGELDLIICEIRDGDAEDITSALINVDKKRLEDEVEAAVLESHERLELSLEDDVAELRQPIDSALARLEANVKAEAGSIAGALSHSRIVEFGGTEAVKDRVEHSCSASAALDALGDMKHMTSLELYADVEYLSSASV